jgi:1,4-dihydroxy-2-naphthoate octaprenyltransferase
MTISSFLKLVEIKTKIASFIPFSLGSIYAIYHFNSFDIKNFILMFISLICFDMATTTINNYTDYKTAIKTSGYGYQSHNAIVRDNLEEATVLLVIFILLIIAILFGVILYFNTDIIILILGAISFFVGIHYTYGPIPISRMPIGEIFSGLFMGFIITFISTYIHIYDQNFITILYRDGLLEIIIKEIEEIVYIFLISIPTICGIANIMLANNICDMEEDLQNKRYTLPIYIGTKKSLKLFKLLYYAVYIDMILLIILGVEPITSIITLITIIPVYNNINKFSINQSKKETFKLSLKNFIIINVTRIFSLVIASLIRIL